jgi:hypothetical protein
MYICLGFVCLFYTPIFMLYFLERFCMPSLRYEFIHKIILHLIDAFDEWNNRQVLPHLTYITLPLSICVSMNIGFVSISWLSWIMLQWTWKHSISLRSWFQFFWLYTWHNKMSLRKEIILTIHCLEWAGNYVWDDSHEGLISSFGWVLGLINYFTWNGIINKKSWRKIRNGTAWSLVILF